MNKFNSINSIEDINPVTPDWLNKAENDRYPASMKYWFPRLCEVSNVRVPHTEWVRLEPTVIEEGTIHEMYSAEYEVSDITTAVEDVGGPPAFLRTDMASNGLDYGGSCIENLTEKEIEQTAGEVIRFNTSFAEIPFSILAVREWLDIVSFGTDFGVEIRTFISNGDISEWGFYWSEADVDCDTKTYEKTAEIAHNRGGEVFKMAEEIASRFNKSDTVTDEWSVDFVLTESDEWYCTDMAPAKMSQRPNTLRNR